MCVTLLFFVLSLGIPLGGGVPRKRLANRILELLSWGRAPKARAGVLTLGIVEPPFQSRIVDETVAQAAFGGNSETTNQALPHADGLWRYNKNGFSTFSAPHKSTQVIAPQPRNSRDKKRSLPVPCLYPALADCRMPFVKGSKRASSSGTCAICMSSCFGVFLRFPGIYPRIAGERLKNNGRHGSPSWIIPN